MNSIHRSKGGFALITVIGVLAILVVYLAAIESAIQMSRSERARIAAQQDRAQATASLIALAVLPTADGASSRTLETPGGLKAAVRRMALPAGHEFWTRLPGIQPEAGDELLTIKWADTAAPTPASRYIVNRTGRRTGVISLGAGDLAVPRPKP